MMIMQALSCKQSTSVTEAEQMSNRVTPPEWARNANIYEVNIRQYTPEGTFEAFRHHLPRLKEMGVDILWLMPIHPISVPKRKGTLGSYYAVSDFRAINPLFGDHDTFLSLYHSSCDETSTHILQQNSNHFSDKHPHLRQA